MCQLLIYLLEPGGKSFDLPLLLHDTRLQFGYFAFFYLSLVIFLQELVKQHRVHCFVANGVRLALSIAHDQIGVHLLHLLGDKAKLRNGIRIKLAFITKGDWLERQDRFARLVHRFNLILKARGRGKCA